MDWGTYGCQQQRLNLQLDSKSRCAVYKHWDFISNPKVCSKHELYVNVGKNRFSCGCSIQPWHFWQLHSSEMELAPHWPGSFWVIFCAVQRIKVGPSSEKCVLKGTVSVSLVDLCSRTKCNLISLSVWKTSSDHPRGNLKRESSVVFGDVAKIYGFLTARENSYGGFRSWELLWIQGNGQLESKSYIRFWRRGSCLWICAV